MVYDSEVSDIDIRAYNLTDSLDVKERDKLLKSFKISFKDQTDEQLIHKDK